MEIYSHQTIERLLEFEVTTHLYGRLLFHRHYSQWLPRPRSGQKVIPPVDRIATQLQG